MRRPSTLVLIAALILTTVFSCTKNSPQESRKLKVVTTTSFITDTVSRVASDRIDLYGLIAYGRDPHAYDPAPQDLARVEDADLVFINGFNLEENLEETLAGTGNPHIVEVSAGVEGIAAGQGGPPVDGRRDKGIDPHTWMDPLNVMVWTVNIAGSLEKADPGNRAYYEERAAAYLTELQNLHREIETEVARIPPDKRILVTDHDALGYFAARYGFKVIGTIIPGFSTNADPSARELADLIRVIEQNQVPAVFIGSTAGQDVRKLSETVRTELGYPVKVFELLTGSLAPRDSPAGTYIGFMRFNLAQITAGLGD